MYTVIISSDDELTNELKEALLSLQEALKGKQKGEVIVKKKNGRPKKEETMLRIPPAPNV